MRASQGAISSKCTARITLNRLKSSRGIPKPKAADYVHQFQGAAKSVMKCRQDSAGRPLTDSRLTQTALRTRLLRLELEFRSPFGGLTANKKSVERLALLAGEALEEGGFPFGA